MKIGVYIGRFQPFHLGHLHVVREALKQCDRLLILVGSANEPRTVTNPWTASERMSMILEGLPGDIPDAIDFGQVHDHGDDRKWAYGVHNAVHQNLKDWDAGFDHQILLVGHSKDHTSFYLKLFPEWGSIEVGNFRSLSATPMREAYFLRDKALPPEDVGEAVSTWGERWAANARDYCYLAREFIAAYDYRSRWALAPHPPTFVTTDALVVCGDEIAMIRRGQAPGYGLMALPGGFLEPNLRLIDNALKEFGEEAGEGLSKAELRKFWLRTQVFDKPGRDPRGRFITHVHAFAIPEGAKPRLRAGDDAEWAGWVHIDNVERSEMFADHFQILQLMVPRREVLWGTQASQAA